MIYIGTRSALFEKNKEKFFEKYKDEFVKRIDERKPLSVKDLEFAFVGNDGKKYYRFTDHLNLPLERFSLKKTLLAWMGLGLNRTEVNDLIATGREALFAGLKGNAKAASAIGFVFHDLEYRGNEIIHTELLYQFVALHYIREDENAEVIDNAIHMAKVKVFKKEVAEKGSTFFLSKSELNLLYKLTEMSELEWTTFWHESLIKEEALKIQLQEIRKALQKR